MSKTETTLETGLETVQVNLFTPESPNDSAIMFAHGYTSDKSGYGEFAEACSQLGVTSLTVDLLSHGQSSGDREDLTIAQYIEGLAVAYDYLVSQPGVDDSRVGGMGGSFGAYLLAALATKRPFESLLLRAPAVYPDVLYDVPRRVFDTEAVLSMPPNPDNSVLQTVNRFAGRVLLVSSAHDAVITPETISAYEQSLSNGEHIVMPNAEHRLDETNRKVFISILEDWAVEL